MSDLLWTAARLRAHKRRIRASAAIVCPKARSYEALTAVLGVAAMAACVVLFVGWWMA